MRSLPIENRAGHFRVWSEPQRNHRYVVGADIATGKVKDMNAQNRRPGMFGTWSDRPDYSAAIVLDLDTCEHVASYHNWIEPLEYAVVLAAIGIHYNKALVVPEANSMGVAVVDYMTNKIRYPKVYMRRTSFVSIDDIEAAQYGFMTTQTTKPLLISKLQAAVSDGTLRTRDADLVEELRTMVYDEQGNARARGRDKDDRVMALGLALQGRAEILYGRDPTFKDPYEDLPEADAAVWRTRERISQERERGSFPGGVSGPGRRFGLPRLRFRPRR